MEAKNIDDVLVAAMNNSQAPVQPAIEDKVPANDPMQEEPVPQQEAAQEVTKPVEAVKPEETQSVKSEESSPIDEYGNPVEKPKMYSEEEVNRLIRERLARGRHAEQAQPVQQQPQQQQQSSEQEENWQQELEKFVEQTIDKRQTKLAEQQWKQQEALRQAEFESKFSTGMGKYSDFREVVAGKPITDSMLLATRNLENPAAFIYGAAKFHSQELDRIAKISDPYAQAAEVGRLHEKMIKTKNVVSNAPKPIEAVTGDIPAKNISQFPPLEQRIEEYAKQKRR